MNNSQYFNYNYNVNKKDNDIFNRSSYTYKYSLPNDTKERNVPFRENNPRCRTPYGVRKDSRAITNFSSNPFLQNYNTDQDTNNKVNEGRNQSIYSKKSHDRAVSSSNLSTRKFDNKPQKVYQPEYQREKITNGYNLHLKNFSNFNKDEIQNPDDLVCNNCVNKTLSVMQKEQITPHHKLDKDFDDSALSFNQTLVTKYRNKIDEKVNERVKLTDWASRSINKFKTNTKENFQLENENKTSFLDKRGDYVIQRAKERNKNIETTIANNLDKFMNNERLEKTKYFIHYVDNIQQASPRQQFVLLSDDPEVKKLYSAELLKEITNKRESDKERILREKEEERGKIQQSLTEYEAQQREKLKKEEAMNHSFIYTNLKIMNDKRKKEIIENEKDKKFTLEQNKKISEDIEGENKGNEIRKLQMKQHMQQSLENQIENKKIKKQEELSSSKSFNEVNMNRNPFRFCSHDSLYSCSICSKSYPKKMLSPNLFSKQVGRYLTSYEK